MISNKLAISGSSNSELLLLVFLIFTCVRCLHVELTMEWCKILRRTVWTEHLCSCCLLLVFDVIIVWSTEDAIYTFPYSCQKNKTKQNRKNTLRMILLFLLFYWCIRLWFGDISIIMFHVIGQNDIVIVVSFSLSLYSFSLNCKWVLGFQLNQITTKKFIETLENIFFGFVFFFPKFPSESLLDLWVFITK